MSKMVHLLQKFFIIVFMFKIQSKVHTQFMGHGVGRFTVSQWKIELNYPNLHKSKIQLNT